MLQLQYSHAKYSNVDTTANRYSQREREREFQGCGREVRKVRRAISQTRPEEDKESHSAAGQVETETGGEEKMEWHQLPSPDPRLPRLRARNQEVWHHVKYGRNVGGCRDTEQTVHLLQPGLAWPGLVWLGLVWSVERVYMQAFGKLCSSN